MGGRSRHVSASGREKTGAEKDARTGPHRRAPAKGRAREARSRFCPAPLELVAGKGDAMHALMQVLDEVGSTNDLMRERAEKGAPHGSAVAARRQTAGRGRRGHVWESPAGNLYLSVLLRPEVSPSRLPGLAAACGLGVLDGLGALGVSNKAQLKWPNDVLAHGRKLAGILVEAGRDQAGGTFAVCGVGLNLESAPRALSAICLAELGAPASFWPAAEALGDAIAGRVDAWSAAAGERPLDGIRDDYLAHLAWRGEKVRVLEAETGAQLECGTLETVDPWGRAVVGSTAYAAEQASLRRA